ncbi:hypothetical protein [Haloquadratum walsbyi]|nr:hypothetical protein [Haloquadratum walsbyi]
MVVIVGIEIVIRCESIEAEVEAAAAMAMTSVSVLLKRKAGSTAR